jgi:hypothetical protein
MADWSPIYKTGTATLTNGQTAVTGQGTSWNTAGLRAGDQIKAAGFSVTIAAINTNGTGLTLAEGWPGVTRTALPYEILRVSDADRLIAAHADLMAALVPNLTSLGGLTLAANKGIHATGAGALATHNLTAFMRGVLGSADGSAARQALGANDAANLNAGILPAARLPFVAGTWTPTLGGSTTNPTATYTIQQGNYVKLGRYVYIHWRLDANVSNAGAGGLQILGAPFASSFVGGGLKLGVQTLLSSAGAIADLNGSIVRFLSLSGEVATTSILKTGTTGIIIGSGIYATAA